MATVIIVAASVGFLLLFGATATLVFLNWSEKTLTPVLSILVVGTATTLAAVLVSLKPATIESAFTTSVLLDTVAGVPPLVDVDPNNSRLSDRLSEFVRLGQPAINQNGKTVVTIEKPNDESERWEHGHLPLPKDTKVRLIHLASSSTNGVEKFIVKLEKPRFFVIDFTVEPLLATGMGILPKGVSAVSPEVAARCQTYQFEVTMRAAFERITAGNQQTQEYKDWANWLFSNLQDRVGD